MNESGNLQDSEQLRSGDQKRVIPNGLRSGVITAITVLLGFSLLFLRSWAFELPGDWTLSSAAAAILLLIAIVLELVALWRSLQPKDELANEYRLTLRWFLASIVLLLVSLVIAALSYSQVFKL
jgi:hypothetical protein